MSASGRDATDLRGANQPAPHVAALAEFAAGLQVGDLPAPVATHARWIIADSLACAVAGDFAPEVRALVATQRARRGAGAATVLGRGVTLPPDAAALVNGTAGTWHDLDEGNLHTKGHPGIQILPSALAEAEARDAGGAELLAATAAAYEVSCRIYGATRARLAVHPHGTFGPLAAAVAVGRLRGIGAAAMARLINLAAPLGIAASRRALAEGATVRNAYTGASGTMAWLALDLLESGFTAEGGAVRSDFGGLHGEAFDQAAATAGLGTRWRLLEGFFKLFPYGRYVHSALDLVDDIAARRRDKVPATAVEQALVETYFMAATMGQQAGTSPFGLRFSIPAAVAARLLGLDREPLADFDALFARPELHALARRVEVRERPDFTAAYPARQRSRLTLRLADGTVETAEAEHIRGEPENPHPTSALEAKFRALTAPAWGADGAEAALAALMRIEALPRLRPVTASWRAAAARTQPEEEHDAP